MQGLHAGGSSTSATWGEGHLPAARAGDIASNVPRQAGATEGMAAGRKPEGVGQEAPADSTLQVAGDAKPLRRRLSLLLQYSKPLKAFSAAIPGQHAAPFHS